MAFSPKLLQQGASGAGAANYIEDVFSCFLYTGTGSSQTITNGIDLAGEGGLVWIKDRTSAYGTQVYDTVRGAGQRIGTYGTFATQTDTVNGLTAFTSSGFSLGSDSTNIGVNRSGDNFASWTFRKQPKFFDVVTYTGNNVAGRTVAHNLGSVPGFFMIKRTDSTGDWRAYHRDLGANKFIYVNSSDPAYTSTDVWNNTTPTSTAFTLGNLNSQNDNGATYVAYLFAHDAGGFGLTGSDNVISCGSYSGTGTTNFISLGWEPQWILVKRTDSTGDWYLLDNMRGWFTNYNVNAVLFANTSGDEGQSASGGWPDATGFYAGSGAYTSSTNLNGASYIYIAIRRGPMKVPTLGTSVFSPVARAGTGASTTVNTSVRPDAIFQNWRAGAYGSSDHYVYDRLRGFTLSLFTNLEAAEANQTVSGTSGMGNSSYGILNTGMNASAGTFVDYAFTRAPSFFDEVCYTGNGSTQNVSHNLGVAPELIFIKNRDDASTDWWVYAAPLTTPQNKYLRLQSTDGESTATGLWGSSLPTSTTFGLGNFSPNQNTKKFVAYLFATCAGVSKVGSYTGDNSNGRIIDCGFTSGARFVLIKRTDQGGQWAVWDTARGINAGGDPYLMLNNTLAEVAGYDDIDAHSTGFIINDNAPSPGIPVNVAASTYIFLAIA